MQMIQPAASTKRCLDSIEHMPELYDKQTRSQIGRLHQGNVYMQSSRDVKYIYVFRENKTVTICITDNKCFIQIRMQDFYKVWDIF